MDCGCCALPLLLRCHPELVTGATLSHPRKTIALLARSDGRTLRRFCDKVPSQTMRGMLPALFSQVSDRQFIDVVVPLLSSSEQADALSKIACSLDTGAMLEVLNGALPGRLVIVLQAPPEALATIIADVGPGRIGAVVVPLLQEPEDLLRDRLVPLLRMVERPAHMAKIVDQVDASVLIALLRGVRAEALAAVVNGFCEEDFNTEGHVIQLLRALNSAPDLANEKIVPLMEKGEPSKLVRLVQGIPAEKLLAVLSSTEADGVLRLLENTNADFAVRLFQLPLDSVISSMAGGFADVMADRNIAELVKHSTDTLQAGLAQADGVLARGLQARGADPSTGYKFGDLTRGLLSMGQESLEPLQEGWEALQKDVALKTETLTETLQQQVDEHMQKVHASLGQNAQLLKEGLKGGLASSQKRLRAFSCQNDVAYKKGLQEEEVF
ncbi:DHRS13 [Symbiodinium natans]|uniref:DHRS13 protein n=1 Tax=Symbiodinium natans TaxID=878477 RepID=A0A812V6I3_9DINO|nr:DHRS13 [Symbiodinium natans]